MNEKYEEKLWNQIDLLHQKIKRQQISFNYLMDILKKFQEACLEFSKNIQNILIKSQEIIENHSTSMYETSEKFIRVIEDFGKEFKEAQNNIKVQILEQMVKNINEEFNKEKDLYNSYNKYKAQYNNSKLTMEKNQKNYEHNMKLCENILIDGNKMNLLLYTKEEEKLKNNKNMNISIKEAKQAEEKYITSLESLNKAREIEIKKHSEMLEFYQKHDINFYEKVKMSIGLYLTIVNKMNNNIMNTINILDKSYREISVEKDINDYISKNKSEKKLPTIFNFISYIPISDPTLKTEDPNKLNLYLEVLRALKINFKEIRKDINIEEEMKRKKFRNLCKEIFKIGNNAAFTKEEKNELLSFIEISSFKEYLIEILLKQKEKGRLKRPISLIKDLSDLILKILSIAEKEKDYILAKNCLALSQNYYFEEKIDDKKNQDNNKKGKKIYLFELIKKNKWISSLEFWDKMISLMIENEIKKNKELTNKQGLEENEQINQNRLCNICFSQLLEYTSNMIDFGMKRNDVDKIIEKYSQKYGMSKKLIDSINESIDMKPQIIEDSMIKENKENFENKNKEENEKEVTTKEKENQEIINSNPEDKVKKNNLNQKNDNKDNSVNSIKLEEKKIEENIKDVTIIEKNIKKIEDEKKEITLDNNKEEKNRDYKEEEKNKDIADEEKLEQKQNQDIDSKKFIDKELSKEQN